jgi:hypothetical protein
MLDLLTIAAILIAYSAFSKPLGTRGVTSAMVLTACGFVAGTSVLGLIDVELESATAQRLAEGALVLLVFPDRRLRRRWARIAAGRCGVKSPIHLPRRGDLNTELLGPNSLFAASSLVYRSTEAAFAEGRRRLGRDSHGHDD